MSDERTMEPTPLRREQARREGRFPRSRELAIGALLLVAISTLHVVGESWFEQGTQALRESMTRPASLHTTTDEWNSTLRRTLAVACFRLFPWLILSVALVLLAQWIQGGVFWLPAKLRFDFSRLCAQRSPPMAGRLAQALFGVLAFCGGIALLSLGLWMLRGPLCELGLLKLPLAVANAASLLSQLMLPVLAVCVALCGLEYGMRLRSYYTSLKMSAADLRDEAAGRHALHVAPAGTGPERRREFDMPHVRPAPAVHRLQQAVTDGT